MTIKRKYKKSRPQEQMYVVINRHGEVYTGMVKGQLTWSYEWTAAKPLFKESTSWLLEENPGAEVVDEEEILK